MFTMRNKCNQKQEEGFVSIIVTMVMMIVITLIVLGFAQLARREQKAALDRQLSTQAFYAAESAVNDAEAILRADSTAANPNCNLSGSYSSLNRSLDAGNVVQYSCLIVNPSPADVKLTVDSAGSTLDITGINPLDGTPRSIGRLEISWHAQNGNTAFASSYSDLLPVPTWGNTTGMLKFAVTPASVGFDRNALNLTTDTYYLYPSGKAGAGSGSVTYGFNSGSIVDGHCNTVNTPNYCKVVVTGLTSLASSRFTLRLSAIYSTSNVTIQAFDTSGAQLLNIRGAQAIVDATGRANDVLRRIQVRIPARIDAASPPYALQSITDICKKLEVAPGFGNRNGCP